MLQFIKLHQGVRMINLKRTAFTMIELVMVIVVLGILASLALPRMERDVRQEAGDNILSAIRYTQHLALMDNKANINENPAVNWQRAFWQIRFTSAGGDWSYVVASNNDYNTNLDEDEAAIDPANGKLMYTADSTIDSDESPNVFLSHKYGIDNVDFSDCEGQTGASGGNSGTRHIGFDYLGRLHKGVFGATDDLGTLMHENCTIKFEFTDNDIEDLFILVQQETGYAYIVGQNAS